MNESNLPSVRKFIEAPDRQSLPVVQVKAPHRPRKGHKKSRRGCVICKQRKIKCDETRPQCGPCTKRCMDCRYAPAKSRSTTAQDEIVNRLAAQPMGGLGVPIRPMPPGRQPEHSMGSGPGSTIFATRRHDVNGDDTNDTPALDLKSIRLFHHFITVAYPHLPAGNECVWKDKVPLIAEQREYLMHAVLGLAATHLHLANQVASSGRPFDAQPYDGTYEGLGIRHRGAAISGLNEALTKASWNQVDLDAMLATAYALTFQATYMHDGLIDFMTMVRGCALLTHRIVDCGHGEQINSTFNLDPMAHVKVLDGGWKRSTSTPKPIKLSDGINALDALKPYCQSAIQKELFDAIHRAYMTFDINSREGFIEYCTIFNVWHDSNATDFAELVAEGQSLIRVLLSFYLAIELFVAPAFSRRYELVGRTDDLIVHRMHMAISWIKGIHEGLDWSEDWRDLMVWPIFVGKVFKARISVIQAFDVDAGTPEISSSGEDGD
jgi:hypothetical protein